MLQPDILHVNFRINYPIPLSPEFNFLDKTYKPLRPRLQYARSGYGRIDEQPA